MVRDVVLFDVHAHLTHERLTPILSDVLARARDVGVRTIISNGLNPEDNQNVLDLSRAHPCVRPAFGYYPVDAVLAKMRANGHEYSDQRTAWDPNEAVAWVEQHADSAFAIGEIGLDGYWVPEQFWEAQEQVFIRLVRLAMSVDKPIIIHTRKREARAFELLTELGAKRVNWHCFGGRVSLARRIAAAGHYLSIPANARRNEAFTGMLRTLPRSQVLLETDCPYLGPERDVTNEPANVSVTSRYAAELWGASEADVERQLADNFEQLFGVAP
jgi:TatD DNase family protein